MSDRACTVGLIADTHGLLRPEALAALRGSDRIVHAGDIGDPSILDRLAAIAPVTAVRGNNDTGAWARALRDVERLDVDGIRIIVVHDLARLDVDAAAADCSVVVSGHSHQPRSERRDGVLYVNPGSAGPRRFRLPVSIGTLAIAAGRVEAALMTLALEPAAPRMPSQRRAGRR